MHDYIRDTAGSGGFVLYEEIARDGAQGKTLLTANERVRAAKMHSAVFGNDAFLRTVFVAGFPSAGPEEFDAVRAVASEVDECYVAAIGRLAFEEVDLLIKSVAGAKYKRIALVLPVSIRTCSVLMRQDPISCLQVACDCINYALEIEPDLIIDIYFADATRADESFVADAALTVTESAASIVHLCDTVGSLYPVEARGFFARIQAQVAGRAQFAAHMHNDLGFGLINTLEALGAGIRGLTGAWLGLGERSGLPATEQLLFILGHEPEKLCSRLDIAGPYLSGQINLKALQPAAAYLSEAVGFVPRSTDPIIGSGVNTISTGTPFKDPELFSPFDPLDVLGRERKVYLTPLANTAIISAVAEELGFCLLGQQKAKALGWLKHYCHETNTAVVERSIFRAWLENNIITDVRDPSIKAHQILSKPGL